MAQRRIYCPLPKKKDFKNTFDFGLKIPSRLFVFYARPNGLGSWRVGLAVGRKVGCAVVRNRIRRRLREVLRRQLVEQPLSCDLVVVARTAAVDAPFDEFNKAVLKSLTKLAHEDTASVCHKGI